MTNRKHNKDKTPIVVADAGWAETLPEWIKREIHAERLIGGMCKIAGRKKSEDRERVGDAEVCAYLYTASLKAPLDPDLVDVYVNLLSGVMTRRKDKSAEAARALAEPLTDCQRQKLKDLKISLYRARGGEAKHPVLECLCEFKAQAFRPRQKLETSKQERSGSDGAGISEPV